MTSYQSKTRRLIPLNKVIRLVFSSHLPQQGGPGTQLYRCESEGTSIKKYPAIRGPASANVLAFIAAVHVLRDTAQSHPDHRVLLGSTAAMAWLRKGRVKPDAVLAGKADEVILRHVRQCEQYLSDHPETLDRLIGL